MFSTPQECRTIRELLAGHALNTLVPDEARAVSAHLVTCPGCRDEHGCLAAVASHLSLLRDALANDAGPRPVARRRPACDAKGARLTLSQWVTMKPCVKVGAAAGAGAR